MKTPPLVRTCLQAFVNNINFILTELHVKTVKYFKSIERVQIMVEERQAELKAKGSVGGEQQVGSME
jgi:hypothetical protein